MNRPSAAMTAPRLFYLVGLAGVATAIIGAMTLSGANERIVTSGGGVIAIVCGAVWRRLSDSGSQAQRESSDRRVWSPRATFWINIFGYAAVLSGLGIGYLVYFSADSLPHRRLYLALLTFLGVACAGLAVAVARASRRPRE